MKKNEISNYKIPLPGGVDMNDKDYLNSTLELEKNLSNIYSIVLSEASNDDLYECYFTMFEDSKDMARDIYNSMFKNGWYTLEKADTTKINDKINSFTQQLNSFEID